MKIMGIYFMPDYILSKFAQARFGNTVKPQ
jgi:hypothetical protein